MSFTLALFLLHTWLGGNLPDSAPPLPFHATILGPVCPGLPLPQFCLLAWSLPLGPPFLLLCTLSYTEVCAQAGAPWGGAPCSFLWAFPNTCVYVCTHVLFSFGKANCRIHNTEQIESLLIEFLLMAILLGHVNNYLIFSDVSTAHFV